MGSEKEKELLDYLASLGFEGENLAGKIHVQAEKNLPLIVISQYKFFGEERMRYDLHLRRDPQFDAYRLEKYEATLRNSIPIDHKIINGIDTAVLEQKMKTVNWQDFFAQGTVLPDDEKKHIRQIIDELNNVLRDEPDGIRIVERLQYKYIPENQFDDAAKEMQHAYETSRAFIATEYGMVNANLAWQIMSGRFDDLFEKFRVLGLEDFPGTEVYLKLEEILSDNPDHFEFRCSRNEPEGWIDFTVPVEKIDGWYSMDTYNASLIPHPVIDHGHFDNIDTRRLEEEMQQINWHDDRKLFIFHDDREPDFTPAVADIQEQVYRLSQNMAGADVADKLMLKYWGDATFFQDMVPQTAWDELEERKPRTETFGVEITSRAAYNLLNGRAVLNTPMQQITGENLPFVRLNVNEEKTNGHYARTYANTFTKSDMELQLHMLAIENAAFYSVRNSLLHGGIVPVTRENGMQIKVEANPEQRTLNIYTRDMKPIPINLRMDPDWQPDIHQQRKEQERKQSAAKYQMAKPVKRNKGRGL